MRIRHQLLFAAIGVLCWQNLFSQPDSIPSHLESLRTGYQGGATAFFETFGKNMPYPKEARTRGVMGLSSFAFKVDCNNNPHSFLFKTKIGYDIEEAIEFIIKKHLTQWVDCNKRDSSAWINYRVAFTLNKMYKPTDADFVLTGYGPFPGQTDDELIKDLERALKKGQDNNARLALSRLILRFPYNQEYKKQLREINAK